MEPAGRFSCCLSLGMGALYAADARRQSRIKVREGSYNADMQMTADDAVRLYQLLTDHAIRTWVIGGWGVDALLGEQNRLHKDLDILVLVDDVERLLTLLEQEGFHFAYLWEENRFVPDARGKSTATAFVWQDDAACEIDAHALRLDEMGNGIPAWLCAEGFRYPRESLAEKGVIAGVIVPCISPQMQLECHTGYELPDSQQQDLERIRAKFGVR